MAGKKVDARTAAASAPPEAAASVEQSKADARRCPECGGTSFATVTLVAAKTDARDQTERQAELDKIVQERGELQSCVACGYRTHANDDLTPAKV